VIEEVGRMVERWDSSFLLAVQWLPQAPDWVVFDTKPPGAGVMAIPGAEWVQSYCE